MTRNSDAHNLVYMQTLLLLRTFQHIFIKFLLKKTHETHSFLDNLLKSFKNEILNDVQQIKVLGWGNNIHYFKYTRQ